MLSERIKKLRLESDMTQKQLADILGLTPKMISFYELGQRNPPNDILMKMSAIFNVSTDYLLGKSDSSPLWEFLNIYMAHKDFAQKHQIPHALLARIEKQGSQKRRGEVSISSEDIRTIANALGVDEIFLSCLADRIDPYRTTNAVIPDIYKEHFPLPASETDRQYKIDQAEAADTPHPTPFSEEYDPELLQIIKTYQDSNQNGRDELIRHAKYIAAMDEYKKAYPLYDTEIAKEIS